MTALPPRLSQPSDQHLTTGGYLLLHAVPSTVTPHLRWAIESVVKNAVSLNWQEQAALPGHQRAELRWSGQQGTAAQLASALRVFDGVFFEVTERATPTTDAVRFMYTPSLGICAVGTDVLGNFTVTEDRVKYAFEQAEGSFEALYQEFSLMLGEPWDEQLEPLRAASGQSNITHINQKT